MAKHQQHNKRESIIMTDQLKATEKKQAATEDIKNESKNIFFVFDAWRSMDTASVGKMKIPYKDMRP